MFRVYYTTAAIPSRDFLLRVLKNVCGADGRDLRFGAHGKPFLAEGPAFSLSHSGNLTAVAIGEKPVGLDVEILRDIRPYSRLLSSFSEAEQREIAAGGAEAFFAAWTAKESYVKFRGENIALARRLAFFGGTLYYDGSPLPVSLCGGKIEEYRYTLCSEEEEKPSLVRL